MYLSLIDTEYSYHNTGTSCSINQMFILIIVSYEAEWQKCSWIVAWKYFCKSLWFVILHEEYPKPPTPKSATKSVAILINLAKQNIYVKKRTQRCSVMLRLNLNRTILLLWCNCVCAASASNRFLAVVNEMDLVQNLYCRVFLFVCLKL